MLNATVAFKKHLCHRWQCACLVHAVQSTVDLAGQLLQSRCTLLLCLQKGCLIVTGSLNAAQQQLRWGSSTLNHLQPATEWKLRSLP